MHLFWTFKTSFYYFFLLRDCISLNENRKQNEDNLILFVNMKI